MIVDTHAAHRAGSAAGNSDFFNQRAMEHIARCLELMRALELPFNLRTAYNLLANKDHLKNTLDTVAEHPRAQELLPLVQHFETFYLNLKSEGQSEGELGTIGNFLAPYQQPAVAEVFCSEEPDTISIDQVDQGKKICLSISEEYAHERKYVFSILKLLFYQHGLRRLDLKACDPLAFWKKNLLVLVGEEFQDVVTSSVGGMSDYTVSGKIREANVALIVLTQSYLSLLPPHANRDQANVLMLNLRNRMIFRAADAECAKQSAEFIGKRIVNKRSRSVGSRGVTYSYQETEEYKLKPHPAPGDASLSRRPGSCWKAGSVQESSLKMLTGAKIRKSSGNRPAGRTKDQVNHEHKPYERRNPGNRETDQTKRGTGDSLIRLARKLQEQNRHQMRNDEECSENLRALHKTLTDLRSYTDIAKSEIGAYRHYNQDEAYTKARVAVVNGTATPQEAAIELLRAGVADKTMTADFALEQLAKLLRPDLPVSRRIQIREIAKAAFETGDDVVGKIKPFLKGADQQQTEHQQARKTVAIAL